MNDLEHLVQPDPQVECARCGKNGLLRLAWYPPHVWHLGRWCELPLEALQKRYAA